MKIQPSTQNNFKGAYIVKGNSRQISQVLGEICQRSFSPNAINSLLKTTDSVKLNRAIEPLKDFSCIAEPLTGLFGKNQPLVEILFVTGEDCSIISDYYKKKLSIPNEGKMDDVHLTIFNNRLQKFLKENTENYKEYNCANKQFLEEGNAGPLTSFILKRAVIAKKKLAEILSLGQIKDDVKTLRANEVLEAINNKSFDFNTGNINKYGI